MTPLPNKLRRTLEQRPPSSDVKGQLFWLVDVIFICSETGLHTEAGHLRRALGHLGKYIEEGTASERERAFAELSEFERVVSERPRRQWKD